MIYEYRQKYIDSLPRPHSISRFHIAAGIGRYRDIVSMPDLVQFNQLYWKRRERKMLTREFARRTLRESGSMLEGDSCRIPDEVVNELEDFKGYHYLLMRYRWQRRRRTDSPTPFNNDVRSYNARFK